jgi:DNA polymerase-3 subunit epsilon
MTAPNWILALDFETTGLVDFKAPSDAPHQPHAVQIGAILYDLDAREEVETIEVIVRPAGWTIPDEAAAVHGITTERALAEGIPEAEAFAELLRLWGADAPRPRVAHNRSFDDRIARIGLKRYFGTEAADNWKAAPGHCTAVLATPIVKCPPTAKMIAARRTHFKTPTLTEAYQHFFGEGFDGAHSALADCRACLRVYLAILDLQQPTLAAA